MKFGLDKKTRKRIEPKHGELAICPCCDAELTAKCGKIKVHHWAHKHYHNCDHWWETETVWHRNWKNKFPFDWQERVKVDPINNEKHIADVLIPNKELIIEFQNSSISRDELESRERFYKKMIWVVNAQKFFILTSPIKSMYNGLKEIEVKHSKVPLNTRIIVPHDIVNKIDSYRLRTLQNVKNGFFEKEINNLMGLFDQEIEILVSRIHTDIPQNWKGVAAVDVKKKLLQSVIAEALKKVDTMIENNRSLDEANQYYQYFWVQRRKVWNYAKQHVFLDTGKELLWMMSDSILKKVPTNKFVKKYGNPWNPSDNVCQSLTY